jgi:hypothetical protein
MCNHTSTSTSRHVSVGYVYVRDPSTDLAHISYTPFRVIPSFKMLLDDEQDGVELERLIAGKNRYMVFSFAFRNVYFSS